METEVQRDTVPCYRPLTELISSKAKIAAMHYGGSGWKGVPSLF